MTYFADVLLILGAVGAAGFCLVLARKLSRFSDLEKGVGGAIASLAQQVDDLNKAMMSAKAEQDGAGEALSTLTDRAETVSRQLELMMASLHDLTDGAENPSRTAASPVASASVPPEATLFQSVRTTEKTN